jgi:hypothetical protein
MCYGMLIMPTACSSAGVVMLAQGVVCRIDSPPAGVIHPGVCNPLYTQFGCDVTKRTTILES